MHGIPPTLGTPLDTKHCPVIGSDEWPIGQALAGAATTTGAATNSAPHAAASSALEIPARTAMARAYCEPPGPATTMGLLNRVRMLGE